MREDGRTGESPTLYKINNDLQERNTISAKFVELQVHQSEEESSKNYRIASGLEWKWIELHNKPGAAYR